MRSLRQRTVNICCEHCLEWRKKVTSVGIEKTISSMLNFYPINLLHPLKFSIQLLLFNINISHLFYKSRIHLIELSLKTNYFILMFLHIIYTVFQMFSKSLQVNIEVSFYWSKHFSYYSCNQPSLYFF